MGMIEFETKAFKIKIQPNGLKEIIIKENTEVQADDVWESNELSYQHLPLAGYYVLLESEENSSISPEARRAVASEDYNKNVKALAVCSQKTFENIMGNLFLKVNRPKVTTRFFDSREKAIVWLEDRMAENK
jgi:hypothetical protein